MKQIALYLVTPFARLYKTWDTWYTKRLLEKRWTTEYETELAKLDGKKYPWYPELVKNQRSHVRSVNYAGNVTAGADQFMLFRIGCATARKLTTLSEIVGIQPMSGPVGLVYHMGFKEPPDQPERKEGEGTKLRLEITSHAIEARSRKLQARMTPELAQDLLAQHGIDVEAELTEVIAMEIAHEMINEVLTDLRTLAQKNDSFIKVMNGRTATIEINSLCNDVARTTRRGPGNFVIGSPMFVTYLQAGAKTIFTPMKNTDYISGLTQVGILNGTIKVYCALSLNDDVIIGYKGASGECDTGYIFSPYVPVMSSGVVIDSQTFQPVISLMTRYGKWYPESTDTTKVFAPGSTYYRTAKEPTAESLIDPPYNPVSVTEDYIFPHPSGRGSLVEVLPGGKDFDNAGYVDLDFFKDRVTNDLKVDIQSTSSDNSGNANSASE